MTDRRDRCGSDRGARPAGGSRFLGWRRFGVLVFAAAATFVPVGLARADVPREYAGTLSFSVTALSPILVTAGGGNQLTLSGTVTNTGKQTVDDLQYVVQRGDALPGVPAVRAELAHPSQPAAIVTQEWQDFGSSLPPGGSEPFRMTVGIVGDAVDSLAVTQRGVYPVMFNVNGDLAESGTDGGSFHARVGEVHTVLTVLSLPTTPASTLNPTAGPTVTGTVFNQTWPVVDRPHLGVNGVFTDDDLAATISAGGRLDAVLGALERQNLGPDTVTIELDPELLDELDQMTDGYRVVAAGQQQAGLAPTTSTLTPTSAAAATSATANTSRPSDLPRASAGRTGGPHPGTTHAATSAPTPTSSSESGPTNGGDTATVAGRGNAAAVAFLNRLRQVVGRHRVLLLPYGDPDVQAMAAVGMTDQVKSLAARGRQVANRVLPGLRVLEVADPYGQQADPPTVDLLAAAGYGSTVLAGSAVSHAGGAVGAATIVTAASSGAPVKAVLTDSTVLPDLAGAVRAGTAADRVSTQVTLAAVVAATAFTGGGTPIVVANARRWTPSPGQAGIAPLLQLFTANGLWRGQDLDRTAATARIPATIKPGAPSDPPPLSPVYLGRVSDDQQWVDRLRSSLVKVELTGDTVVDPAGQLDPLDEALTRTFSTALRSDPSGSQAVLNTVEDTITSLRGGVAIHTSGHLTLASASSPLLVTVQNSLPYGVKIGLVIRGGDAVGLHVTEPDPQVIPPGRAVLIRVPTTVSRSGTFAVTAGLVAADGTTWSDPAHPTRLTVSSSAYGTVTVVLVIVAGAVLLIMVVLRITQRLQGRTDTEPPASEKELVEATGGAE